MSINVLTINDTAKLFMLNSYLFKNPLTPGQDSQTQPAQTLKELLGRDKETVQIDLLSGNLEPPSSPSKKKG